MQVGYDDIIELDPDKKYFEKNEEKIYKVLQMMSDDESCETYLSCLRAHLLRNYSSCVETDFPVQYFDAGVPCKKGFSYFIDCGAYTGDSLEAAMQHSENITGYVAFEPIPSNFLNLSKNINKLSDKITNSYLFPCGVSEKTGSIRFINSASSSSISQSGDGEILPIVSIDDALKKFPVTFLKMDIEGAEIMALRGGKNLITEYRPDLAISAYHFVNHYWDIPCLIHEIHPNYDFYLRSHSPATLETVLYAVEK
jgi:FkbM family methyltransferase